MSFIAGVYRVSGLNTTGLPGGLVGLLARSPMIPLDFTLPIAGPVTADLDCLPQACQAENDSIQLTVYVVDQDGNSVNLREASVKKIALLTPQGTTILKDAGFLTSGVDGALQYTTTAADLLEAGTYQLQAVFVLAGNAQTTRWSKFRVGANIDD